MKTWQEVYPSYADDPTANKWVAYKLAGCGARIVGAFDNYADANDALGDDDGDIRQFGEMLCDMTTSGYEAGAQNKRTRFPLILRTSKTKVQFCD